MTKNISLHCIIIGKVQGVYYRAFTQQKAIELGLTGWVRNLQNGDVEAFISGPETLVQKMLKWLYSGPTQAKVSAIHTQEVLYQPFANFEIR
ncbi:MAG: hypothetical protein A3E87_06020 [Gammaproteobacteria bacterium RIFCSPHIGHO2_12_FULL_35_23]|nr:MAG: hypothetical protein A3E87_06020 [Gammaproteobacteria bacterium RIFCSPHIGHO2_12_FULL_35_23]